MSPSKINVLITSFAGTGLPPTLSLALPSTTPISTLLDELDSRLPPSATTLTTRLLLSTLSSRPIPLSSPLPISFLLPNYDDILSLRLHVPLPGGKGGFGSQLRAAGGRMSKRKRGANGAEENGSSRNLDGRRLRTVTEAKALAEYLAVKPEMEKREKEIRRKRWSEIVETAERRQEEIRHGKGKGGLDGRWVEDKEEVGERTREAVLGVMKTGVYRDNLAGGGEAVAGSSSSSAEEEGEESGGSKATTPPSEPEPEPKGKGKGKEVASASASANDNGPARKFFGFDEDDEFMSSDGDES